MLTTVFRETLRAVDPRPLTARAVESLPLGAAPAVLAVGKGAAAMAGGGCDALAARGLAPTLGLVISPEGAPAKVNGLRHVRGGHPVPTIDTVHATEALGDFVKSARHRPDVIVLLSGGATSLMAEPVDGVSWEALRDAFERLHASGAPINAMNAIRRRILRWAGGRLTTALRPARVHCLIVSDVMGNELAAIGSGPCVPDATGSVDLRKILRDFRVSGLPATVLAALDRSNPSLDPRGADTVRVILDNTAACGAAREVGLRIGLHVVSEEGPPIVGEASGVGRAVAQFLVERARSLGVRPNALWVAGGETTVSRPADSGLGGRCQELALAAAMALRDSRAGNIQLLVAGTDGRDGPTDAAGAIVNGETAAAMVAVGRDPVGDLSRHDAYSALAAVDALFKTGPTGNNVNDLLLAHLT